MRFCHHFVRSAAVLFIATLPAFSQTSTPAPAAKPKSTTSATSRAAAVKPAYDKALLKPALLKEQAPATFQVKFETTRGDFTVTVTRAWAPNGVDRFYNLVKHHYYDGARFFRVVPSFVAQFGISAYPAVNAAFEKATIKDDPVTQKNKRGTLTFAKTSVPDSRTTQIFINLRDNSSENRTISASLDSMGFAPFAVVDEKGMNVVEMMYDQYGDSAGMDQQPMEKQGEPYIAEKYPKLDTIRTAYLIGAAAEATTEKPATAPKPQPRPVTPAKPQN
jgi:peptidyl-prolyl cis-trans isomerase A (cyclophilin A)